MKTVKAVVLIFVSLLLINPTANATNEKKMQAKMEKYLGFVMGANKDEGKVLVIPTCQKKPILIKSTTKNAFKEDHSRIQTYWRDIDKRSETVQDRIEIGDFEQEKFG